MAPGNLDCLVEIRAVEQVEAGDYLFNLGEGFPSRPIITSLLMLRMISLSGTRPTAPRSAVRMRRLKRSAGLVPTHHSGQGIRELTPSSGQAG